MSDKRVDPRTGKITWAKLFIDNALARHARVSTIAFGALMLIYLHTIDRKKPFPDDAATACGLLKLSPNEWSEIREELQFVLTLKDGFFHDSDAEKAISNFEKRSKSNAKSANVRWESKGLEDAS